MQTGRTNYGKNMNIVVFSCINFNQKKIFKQTGISWKYIYYKWLVHISLHTLL